MHPRDNGDGYGCTLARGQLVPVFSQCEAERGLTGVWRADNGCEFLGAQLIEWWTNNEVMGDYSEPGKPKQNVHSERFDRSYRARRWTSICADLLCDVESHLTPDAGVQRGNGA